MKPNIIEDHIFEFELFEEDGSVLMAAETSERFQYHKLFRKRYENRVGGK